MGNPAFADSTQHLLYFQTQFKLYPLNFPDASKNNLYGTFVKTGRLVFEYKNYKHKDIELFVVHLNNK